VSCTKNRLVGTSEGLPVVADVFHRSIHRACISLFNVTQPLGYDVILTHSSAKVAMSNSELCDVNFGFVSSVSDEI
jgi:hypothetical protein